MEEANRSEKFRSVLEDLEWFHDKWWLGGDLLSDGDLRRGSVALHLLLADGLLGRAWRTFGFNKEPTLIGPDIMAIAEAKGLRPDLAAVCIAGGGRQRGVEASFIGAFQADNTETGVPADAEEGFSVRSTFVARLAPDAVEESSLDPVVQRRWTLSSYLESAGAIRGGQIIKRREIIQYFRNYVGGAHHDLLGGGRSKAKNVNLIIHGLVGHIMADFRNGICFELLSIGQSVGCSSDLRKLAISIAENPAGPGASKS